MVVSENILKLPGFIKRGFVFSVRIKSAEIKSCNIPVLGLKSLVESVFKTYSHQLDRNPQMI